MGWVDAGGWVSAIVSIICCVYVYGKLTQSVSEHDRRMGNNEERLIDHERRIGRLEGQNR